jgi:ligand-binding sensor domain-containing protein
MIYTLLLLSLNFSCRQEKASTIKTNSSVISKENTDFLVIDTNTKLKYTSGIRSILQDSKGNLWIGNNGIGVLLKNGNSVINFSMEKGLTNVLSFGTGSLSPAGTLEHVFVIKEDKNGNIWFGDRDTGAWKYDGDSVINYTIDEKLKTQMIWNIYEDNNGNLLFAMGDGGVYNFNGSSFERKY